MHCCNDLQSEVKTRKLKEYFILLPSFMHSFLSIFLTRYYAKVHQLTKNIHFMITFNRGRYKFRKFKEVFIDKFVWRR